MRVQIPVISFAILAIFCGMIRAQSAAKTTKPLVALHGTKSELKRRLITRVTTAKEWTALWDEHKIGAARLNKSDYEQMDLDFTNVTVIAIFGDTGDLSAGGYTVSEVVIQHERIVLRVDKNIPQTSGRIDPIRFQCQPWGIVVLPKSDKEIVIEYDGRGLIAQPPEWKHWLTIPAVAGPSP